MKVGIPREIKEQEHRVAITPAGAHELTVRGHDVLIERGAGRGSHIPDEEFAAAGAKIVDTAADVWDAAELVLKVKEPIAAEQPRLRPGQALFTYLHLAASRECTDALLASGCTAIAYETVQQADGSLPLLAPMSEVAGRLAAQVGAVNLMAVHGGRGVLLGGVPGVAPARVVVIGGGVAGMNAARICAGLGADVTVLDLDVDRLRRLDEVHHGRIRTLHSTAYSVDREVTAADLVIGAVLVPGAKAPRLVSNAQVARMRPGSVLVDIAIDQGGCFADSRPTTHGDPTFRVHGSVFYCVANMPGAVPNTATHALTNVTLPYVTAIAEHGWQEAMRRDPALAGGLNVHDGRVLHAEVARAHGLPHTAWTIPLGG